jgi:type II secretory pathway component PulJ
VAPNDEQSNDTPTPEPSPGSEPAPDARDLKSPAESSTAKDEDKKTLLDAVKGALEVTDSDIEDDEAPVTFKSKAEPSTAEGDTPGTDGEKKPDTKDDVSDSALLAALEKFKGDVPLNKIERFREVLDENRVLKGVSERHREMDATMAAIGRDATRMGMTQEDMAKLFAWPRLLASDPQAAVEQLQEFTAQWQQKVGHTLSDDLKQKVDDGVLDEATAKEVAQLRATTSLEKTRYEAETAEATRTSTAQRVKAIHDSVNAYQAELKAKDPDYTPEKHELVVDALTALVTKDGVPGTVADARAMAKKAYETVTQRLSKFRPQPRALSSPTVGRRLNQPAESQPKSMREAIENALAR